jgi:hypothetical protein
MARLNGGIVLAFLASLSVLATALVFLSGAVSHEHQHGA